MPSRKQTVVVVLTIILVASLMCVRRHTSSVVPPSEYPQANLRVDVQVYQSKGNDLAPADDLRIKKAGFFVCTMYMTTEGYEPDWYEWCGPALNTSPSKGTSVVTDTNGNATLWFRVRPNPWDANISKSQNIKRPALSIAIGEKLTEYPYEIIAVDHWLVTVALD